MPGQIEIPKGLRDVRPHDVFDVCLFQAMHHR
jgi:hypothetical protein